MFKNKRSSQKLYEEGALHRTGRNASLLFTTCDLICMCQVGVSSLLCTCGGKGGWWCVKLYEIKVILSAEKPAITEPQSL